MKEVRGRSWKSLTGTPLLQQALTLPGTLSKAYSVFHDYSLGNAILAAFQLAARGLPLAPIASFNRWKNLGRKVRKGEKALSLIMPVTVKRKDKDETPQEGRWRLHDLFDEAQLVQSRPDGRRSSPAGGMDAGVGQSKGAWRAGYSGSSVRDDRRQLPGICQTRCPRGGCQSCCRDAMEDTFPRNCASPAWPHGHG
ncbi:MAG: DUF1738 domain-containing protein [Comamonadaceae bacterium]|nr:DUF1738 domain-containing protein [Comamonadaceae bacterium]